MQLRPALTFLLVFVMVGLVFESAHRGEFLSWDDDINITTNPQLKELTWESLRWMFTDLSYVRRYMPLGWLGWGFERQLFGLTSQSAHWGNIILHAANAGLLFFLVRTLLRSQAGRTKPSRENEVATAAMVGALLWGLNPLRVEVVAWASGRLYAQATFFLLCSILAYLRGTAPVSKYYKRWIIISILAFAASLLTYPIALGYVGVLVIIDFWALRRLNLAGKFWRNPAQLRIWLEKLPFLVVTISIGAMLVISRFNAAQIWEPPVALADLGAWPRLMRAFYLWGYYAWKPLMPLELAPVYVTLIEQNYLTAKFTATAIGIVACTMLFIRRRREWPNLLALWLVHLVLLFPVLGWTEKNVYASDRYSYLAGLIWALAGGSIFLEAASRTIRIVPILVLGFYAFLSSKQIRIWESSESLFRHTIKHLGDDNYSTDIVIRLGELLQNQGRLDEAADLYTTSLNRQIVSRHDHMYIMHIELARIAGSKRDLITAKKHFDHALRLQPNALKIYTEAAHVLLENGESKQALNLIEKAIIQHPDNLELRYERAVILQQMGALSQALSDYEFILRLKPNWVGILSSYASALIQAKRLPEAMTASKAALRINPHSAAAHAALGEALYHEGRLLEAVETLQHAVNLNSKLTDAHYKLGLVLEKTGNTRAAIAAYTAITQTNPSFTPAHLHLGLALRDSGQRNEALISLKAALQLDPSCKEASEAISGLSDTKL